MKWNDQNRYSQSGYSSPTIFPELKDYRVTKHFIEDMKLAISREEARDEWLDELRDEHLVMLAYL
jgi:hypothetical protein